MSHYKQVSTCPHCGAPIYVPIEPLDHIPETHFSCSCRFTPWSQGPYWWQQWMPSVTVPYVQTQPYTPPSTTISVTGQPTTGKGPTVVNIPTMWVHPPQQPSNQSHNVIPDSNIIGNLTGPFNSET